MPAFSSGERSTLNRITTGNAALGSMNEEKQDDGNQDKPTHRASPRLTASCWRTPISPMRHCCSSISIRQRLASRLLKHLSPRFARLTLTPPYRAGAAPLGGRSFQSVDLSCVHDIRPECLLKHRTQLRPAISYENMFGPISPPISMIASAGMLFLRAAARMASGLGAS
jgi:hypothetical protein